MLRSFLLCSLSILYLTTSSSPVSSQSLAGELQHSIATLRLGPSNYGRVQLGLFMANRDGSDERPFLSEVNNDYSPAWSTDDKWIVFTSERSGGAELYRMHPDGSNLEQLTDHPAYDDQADFSPDGSHLVFVTSRYDGTTDLAILRLATGATRQLTSGEGGDFRPAWSPDGEWIAFSSDRGNGLPFSYGRWEANHRVDVYLIRPDGSDLRKLTESNGFCGSPAWSADSSQVLTYCMSGDETLHVRRAQIAGGDTALKLIDIATGAETSLPERNGAMIAPALFADGAYAHVRKDGTASRGVYYSDGTRGPIAAIRDVSWSSDGESVVYAKNLAATSVGYAAMWNPSDAFQLYFLSGLTPSVSPTGRYAAMTAGNQLMVMDTATGTRRLVFQSGQRFMVAPMWSADETSLIFSIGSFNAFFAGFDHLFLEPEDRIDGGARIAMINVDGSGYRELTPDSGNDAFPSWNPDASKFVYRTFDGTNFGLRLYDMDSGAITELTNGYDVFPLWSPRGDKIMFSRLIGENYDIYTIRPDGSDLKRLTTAEGNDSHQAWSPDGEYIVYAGSHQGFKDEASYSDAPQPYGEIYVMRHDGTELEQLTDNQWEEGTPIWLHGPLGQSIE
ncbi:MAG: hypothetical protein OXU30_04850 [Gammaproteobacteria bacterium]|nr:hypothetical protein [Gammaproteobacteria bacterium]